MVRANIISFLLLFSSISAFTISQVHALGINLLPVRQKDIQRGKKHCLRYSAPPNELVVLRLNVGPRIDGQSLNLRVFDVGGNLYRAKNNLEGKVRIAFTTTSGDWFDVCLENYMVDSSWSRYGQEKGIVVDVEIGRKARNQNSFQQNEIYSPLLQELNEVQNLHKVMEQELALLVESESGLRNINENTQAEYVKYQVLIIVILITAGICQSVYYKHYFKSKKLL